MVKNKNIIFLVALIGVVVISCYPPPEFSHVPEITFEDVVFKDGGPEIDTLILTFGFQDGNGDLGFFQDGDESYPYHERYEIIDSRDSLVLISSDSEPPFYARVPDGSGPTEFFSQDDTRPPFDCFNYLINQVSEDEFDTVFISNNRTHKNIYVDFYRKINGEYFFFDWTTAFGDCGIDFNGRFPIFDLQNFQNEKPLAGSIDYKMESVGFPLAMRNDTFRIDVSIYDRELNLSNTVSSPDFTLPGITSE